MGFQISCVDSRNFSFDTLPVYKITNYPLVDNAYRPFTLGRFALDQNKQLLARFMCFEESPIDNGTLSGSEGVLLCLKGLLENSPIVCFALYPKARAQIFTVQNEVVSPAKDLADKFTVSAFKGGDQQGLYWGIDLSISLRQPHIQKLLPHISFEVGDTLLGNFYKLFFNNKTQRAGSFVSPQVISKKIEELLFSQENLGKVTVIQS